MLKLNQKINDSNNLQNILGERDKNLKALNYYFNTRILLNGNEITIDTDDENAKAKLEDIFYVLNTLASLKVALQERDVIYIAQILDYVEKEEIIDFYLNRKEIVKNNSGKSIYPKTISQEEYIKELNRNEIILSYGPAGTGKTYLAVCDAVKNFRQGHFQKIILSRPVVEAGESLGFLPGEIKEKVDPYLIPLYDALYELMGKKLTDEYIDSGIIEIAPLAYMRGRTLENAYVILDEAQNATTKQMKLFLTRLGFNSKMVITGDLTQVDLHSIKESGLNRAISNLNNIPGIKIMKFEAKDIVRNPLVQKILERYGND